MFMTSAAYAIVAIKKKEKGSDPNRLYCIYYVNHKSTSFFVFYFAENILIPKCIVRIINTFVKFLFLFAIDGLLEIKICNICLRALLCVCVCASEFKN